MKEKQDRLTTETGQSKNLNYQGNYILNILFIYQKKTKLKKQRCDYDFIHSIINYQVLGRLGSSAG